MLAFDADAPVVVAAVAHDKPGGPLCCAVFGPPVLLEQPHAEAVPTLFGWRELHHLHQSGRISLSLNACSAGTCSPHWCTYCRDTPSTRASAAPLPACLMAVCVRMRGAKDRRLCPASDFLDIGPMLVHSLDTRKR